MINSFCDPKRVPRAFTLLELLVVIAVILILVGIAVPNFIRAMGQAKITQAKVLVQELKGATSAYNTDTRQWPLSGSEHLWAALGGYAPYSSRASKRYSPPYMDFSSNTAGSEQYSQDYRSNPDIQIKQRGLSGQPRALKEDSLRVSTNAEVSVWRPLLDPWRRPIIYISPDELKRRFNDDSTRDSNMESLIAMDREQAITDRNRPANVPFGMSAGQFWSAGPDGITAVADGRPAQSVAGTGDKIRGLFQPGNLSGSDDRDNDGDGVSDASDPKGSGGSLPEDDINSWTN